MFIWVQGYFISLWLHNRLMGKSNNQHIQYLVFSVLFFWLQFRFLIMWFMIFLLDRMCNSNWGPVPCSSDLNRYCRNYIGDNNRGGVRFTRIWWYSLLYYHLLIHWYQFPNCGWHFRADFPLWIWNNLFHQTLSKWDYKPGLVHEDTYSNVPWGSSSFQLNLLYDGWYLCKLV